MSIAKELEDDERVQEIIHSHTRPTVESLRPLFKDYNIKSPDALWRFIEKLTHLWAEAKSAEGDYV